MRKVKRSQKRPQIKSSLKPIPTVKLESVTDYFLGFKRVKGSYNQLYKLKEDGNYSEI